MRVALALPGILLVVCAVVGCAADAATTLPNTSDGQVANVLVAPPSNLAWTTDGRILFWASVYPQVIASPVRLAAADPETRTWHYVEDVDRHGQRISVSPGDSVVWFVDMPNFDNAADTLSVVYRLSLNTGQANAVTESLPVQLSGLLGYARSVVADPRGPGALFAAPPDSLFSLDEPMGTRQLLGTGCALILAISADGSRLLCSRNAIDDLVFISLPGGTVTPFDVHSASPLHFPQGFAFINGALHAAIVTRADSAWDVSEWQEDTGATTPLFETSSYSEAPGLAFWSADGTRIAMWTQECLDPTSDRCLAGVLVRLRVIDRTTGSVQIVASYHGPVGLYGGVVTFAPDDRRIAYVIEYTLYVKTLG